MKELTAEQKNYLLEVFFYNDRFVGWKSIAEKLLEKGSCIVAGTECIWIGGIGNFIKVTPAEDTFGCSEYKFDLEYFLQSEWFKETKENSLTRLNRKVVELQTRYEELSNL
jgi:hypothetical protein